MIQPALFAAPTSGDCWVEDFFEIPLTESIIIERRKRLEINRIGPFQPTKYRIEMQYNGDAEFSVWVWGFG